MKKVVYGAVSTLVAAIAYGIGKSEGNNVKEKAVAFGLNVWAKTKELTGKFIPKCQQAEETQEPANEE